MAQELWQCLDCNKTVELDPHGKCSNCGSQAVAPLAEDQKMLLDPKIRTALDILDEHCKIERLKSIEATNSEWVRILTHYLPEMKLDVYSPSTVGSWLKERLGGVQV